MTATAERVRVAVVDDTEDVRALLRMLLELDERFELVGEGADGNEAIELVDRTRPDLLILDRQMPNLGGLEALPEIRRRSPATAVVLYTAHSDAGTYQTALAAGALEVLDKGTAGAAFVDKLADVLIERAAATGADLEIKVGPVPSSAVLVWVGNTQTILEAVRTHPEVLQTPISDEIYATFDRFLTTWGELAGADREFSWWAKADPAEITALLEAWGEIDRIPDDVLASIGAHWAPPEGRVFFVALTTAILAALETHAGTQRLAAMLGRQWPGHYED